MSQRFEFTKDNSLFELCATAPYRGSFVAHGADLILDGHDHNFQRSHQLRCVDVDTLALQKSQPRSSIGPYELPPRQDGSQTPSPRQSAAR